ncbi:hypothetical protein JOQ06_022728 [Pogonophryne albipinna]|uniref:Uncharacterized protein n=1 Tax=Pogonophryne albipinna TaxID=1090488 RepID=A0AAD6F6H9_9TELE|nr:hypothetical protein JOQ06_022728 [Pogonophryne albipinna]
MPNKVLITHWEDVTKQDTTRTTLDCVIVARGQILSLHIWSPLFFFFFSGYNNTWSWCEMCVCVCVTVDPQFYVTLTISSLLLLTAVVITAKLCYDRSCSQHPPPLSRGVAPPLSLALPRSLAPEDSRQTLHSTSSSTNRER